MDVWLRVLMALCLIVAPSILFVLLYRGLMRLQDQELIARLAESGHLDPARVEAIQDTSRGGREASNEDGKRPGGLGRNAAVAERRAAFLREYGGPESRSTAAHRAHRKHPASEVIGAREVVRCESCGTENAAEFGLCWNCLEWLD